MTVQTSEPVVATPSCHGHGSAPSDTMEAHAHHAHGRTDASTGTKAFGAVLALPRSAKIIGSAVIGLGALLAVGVPLATLTPLVFLGGCLSMHLFMGHGMSHGGEHGSHSAAPTAPDSGSAEGASPRTGV
jgi:hypothetical protein